MGKAKGKWELEFNTDLHLGDTAGSCLPSQPRGSRGWRSGATPAAPPGSPLNL